MRNIATCYSEHAVKVSDSYCSGPLNKNSYISPKSNQSYKKIVTRTYKTKLLLNPSNNNNNNNKNTFFFITISWCSKLISQGFFIKFSYNNVPSHHVGPHHQMLKSMGQKRVHVDQMKVDLSWDLTNARFESGPEPLGSYYIQISLIDQGVVFVVGDKEYDGGGDDCELSYSKLKLVSQYEQFMIMGSTAIASMGCFPGSNHEVGIRVGSDEDGSGSKVLSIFVDRKRVVTVKKLHWNFRGNQVIFLDDLLVDVLWDVSGWFFNNNNNNNNVNYYINSNVDVNNNNKINFDEYYKISKGCGVFMFRTRSGLDSRLWLEEEEIKKLNDKDDDKPEFSLLISAFNNNNNNNHHHLS